LCNRNREEITLRKAVSRVLKDNSTLVGTGRRYRNIEHRRTLLIENNCTAVRCGLVIAYPGVTQADLDATSLILKTTRERDYSGVLDLVCATISSSSSGDSGEEDKTS